MKNTTRVFIVGHNDSIENSLRRHFMSRGFRHVFSNTKDRVDVLNQAKVQRFFMDVRPEYVFLGSVRSGGIAANQKYAAEFLYENLESQNNVIYAAHKFGVKKLLFFATSCVYPKEAQEDIFWRDKKRYWSNIS